MCNLSKLKLIIIIPTKGNLSNIKRLLLSLEENIDYSIKNNLLMEYSIIIACNTLEEQVFDAVETLIKIYENLEVVRTWPLGKVNAIHQAIKNKSSDYILTLDDDIFFSRDSIYNALFGLMNNSALDLISFQSKVLPFSGNNIIKNIIYDVINIKLLRSLYKETDPFLFGRFILIRGSFYPVPSQYIVDDIFLSVYYSGKFRILPNFVYTYGTGSLKQHIKRVNILESARRQVKSNFPEEWEINSQIYKRKLDFEKIRNEPLYYQVCFILYFLVRFVTNKIISKIMRYDNVFW